MPQGVWGLCLSGCPLAFCPEFRYHLDMGQRADEHVLEGIQENAEDLAVQALMNAQGRRAAAVTALGVAAARAAVGAEITLETLLGLIREQFIAEAAAFGQQVSPVAILPDWREEGRAS